jgi:hypothetical protein
MTQPNFENTPIHPIHPTQETTPWKKKKKRKDSNPLPLKTPFERGRN